MFWVRRLATAKTTRIVRRKNGAEPKRRRSKKAARKKNTGLKGAKSPAKSRDVNRQLPPKQKVVYILGAGATQGCLKFAKSEVGLLMSDLGPDMLAELRALVHESPKYESATGLVTSVLNDKTDYEHILTFLDQSPNAVYRQVARDAREIFQAKLAQKIDLAVRGNSGEVPNNLYRALLELYEVEKFPEELVGLVTLNYDTFLDQALIESRRYHIDWGVDLRPRVEKKRKRVIPYLKLHGSFGWTDTFPMKHRGPPEGSDEPLWIPPGILKEKQRYPFNSIWGRVREVLDCDVLRIIGWRLGPNDWDLISLLFSTRHGNGGRQPYKVEYIGSPKEAQRLQKDFPYLGVKSILQSERAGPMLTGDKLSPSVPTDFDTLSAAEQERVIVAWEETSDRNWFLHWLKRNIEFTDINLQPITRELRLPDLYRVGGIQ